MIVLQPRHSFLDVVRLLVDGLEKGSIVLDSERTDKEQADSVGPQRRQPGEPSQED